MIRLLALLSFSAVLPTLLVAGEVDPVDFNRDVRPIFVQHCTECHGGVKQAADLSLVYEESLAAVVEPGSPDDSECCSVAC